MRIDVSAPAALCWLICLTALTGCQSPTPTASRKHDPYRDRVDQLTAPYIDSDNIVGLSIGLLTPEGRFTYHYGLTRADGRTPNDHTLYEIGSISKTFTGLLLADGAVRGRYALDTPVATLLPDPGKLDPAITLRQLATHTSGLQRLPSNMYLSGPGEMFNLADPYAGYSEAKLLTFLQAPPMNSEPGAQAVYSNLAVGLLGYALAQQAGADFASELERRVLNPLGMHDTAIALTDDQRSRMAGPHNGDGDPDHLWHLNVLAGAGGIRSSMSDMLVYLQAQLAPESTPLHQAIVLGQQRQTGPNGPSLGQGTGLGWIFVGQDGWLKHSGQTGGYHAVAMFNREAQIALVILTNTANNHSEDLANRLVQLLITGQAEPIAFPAPVAVAPAVLQRYAGSYAMGLVGVMVITAEGDRLYAQLANQPRLRVYPESQTRFNYRAVEATLEFVLDPDGEVKQLKLYQNGMIITAARLAQ